MEAALNALLERIGLPIDAMWAGARFTWHSGIRCGEGIHTEARLHDLIPHETTFAGSCGSMAGISST